jgi:hypothetical protein
MYDFHILAHRCIRTHVSEVFEDSHRAGLRVRVLG